MYIHSRNALVLASLALIGLATTKPAAAQYAHLTLQSQPGEYIGQGKNYDITYTPANGSLLIAQVRKTVPGGQPGELLFVLSPLNPDTSALLFFGTNALGIPIQADSYQNAQNADFADPGHAGLDVAFEGRANTVTGNFTITDVSFTPDSTIQNGYRIDAFDATFTQVGVSGTGELTGEFSYRSAAALAAVPEVSTTL